LGFGLNTPEVALLLAIDLNCSRLRASERRALQSEAMSLCLGAARKLGCWGERLRKNASTAPSIKDAIETVRLCASLLRFRLSIDTMSSFFLYR
jgi:hypothetical protein